MLKLDNLGNKLVYILGALCVVLLVITFSSCSNASRQKAAREKEIFNKLEAEEKLSKVSQDKVSMQEKIAALTKESEALAGDLGKTKNLLEQEKMISQSIKEELNKVTKEKESLERQLEEALAGNKANKLKK
ncbi:MAG: hypothetical protein C4533_01665 [Candidatus Omnitrophota bacterium]|jgi:septal ring factor EnvC (AmiA/AmiB activator)|nr:MAG: hypothetical protein C4533_01665 [Candidatus Omnitrophota bacterium]